MADHRDREVVAVSAQSDTTTLDDFSAEPTNSGNPSGEEAGRLGYAAVLNAADPSTSWKRVATWCQRAKEEEVI